MRFGVYVIFFLLSLQLLAAPKDFIEELKEHIQSLEDETQMQKRKKSFQEFLESQRDKGSKLDAKKAKAWGIATEYLTPIQNYLNKHTQPNAIACLELQRQLRYDSLVGLPEGSKLPEVAQLGIQLAQSLCPSKK